MGAVVWRSSRSKTAAAVIPRHRAVPAAMMSGAGIIRLVQTGFTGLFYRTESCQFCQSCLNRFRPAESAHSALVRARCLTHCWQAAVHSTFLPRSVEGVWKQKQPNSQLSAMKPQ